jgi:hypothetical protein
MLGPAEPNTCVLQGPPARFIADPQPRAFGQIIRQTLQGPQGEREMPTARPTTHRGQQLGPIRRGDLRGAARAWRILSAFDALRQIAFEPAPHRGLALAADGRKLGPRQPLFHREEDHLRARPQPRSFRGAIQLIEFRALPWCQRWYMEWFHTTSTAWRKFPRGLKYTLQGLLRRSATQVWRRTDASSTRATACCH